MSSDTTHPAPVREHLVSTDPPALLGGRCGSCGQLSFPAESYCPHCGTPGPEPVPLATEGTIYSYTIARFAPPGYVGELPFGVGIVELPEGIRVASTLIAEPLVQLRIGAPVTFRLLELETEDGPALSFAYAVESAGADSIGSSLRELPGAEHD